MKEPGDSFDEVISRLLEKDGEESANSENPNQNPPLTETAD
jgi:predicted CopG family antitoxin